MEQGCPRHACPHSQMARGTESAPGEPPGRERSLTGDPKEVEAFPCLSSYRQERLQSATTPPPGNCSAGGTQPAAGCRKPPASAPARPLSPPPARRDQPRTCGTARPAGSGEGGQGRAGERAAPSGPPAPKLGAAGAALRCRRGGGGRSLSRLHKAGSCCLHRLSPPPAAAAPGDGACARRWRPSEGCLVHMEM